ncbi:signal recognition particle-docking protein FtsY [Lactobacillus intestinalis]|uniref:Signal recognition particle receptor FtsY n=1 Tax=Lactobacillus intestinalis TaxID=151781 RepID=A0A4S2BLV6_9LACO|nr:signal recognition particle-docking protein FtsY [Lactobacillus intestinalis]KAI4310002.1 Signal recognition particle receptor FtsY [Lactobacillus intestinalis]TGY15828.1 signal recognition particle-docking protein FtsY [Lactobacillus intestinalis]
MGLFDRIKKSLFGDKEKEEVKSEETTEEQETASENQEDSEKVEDQTSEETQEATESESDEETEESAPAAKKKEEEESQLNDEVPVETSIQEDEESQTPVDKEVEESTENSDKPEDESIEADDSEEENDDAQLYEKGLEKTNKGFGARLNAFFAQFRTVDEDFFDDLEELLIESDVGYETAEELTEQLRDEAKLQKAKSHEDLKRVIVEKLVDLYDQNGNSEDEKLIYNPDNKPNVYLFVGVNGAGKTTTIGKLAKRFKDEGKSVILAAADTFRAGAVEQLVEWGKRVDVPVVVGKEKADPASVVYDATEKAIKEKADYLLVDTAGRLQNKKNLMSELEKIQRTIKKLLPDQPTETLLVLDGSTGQNALLQAKDFDKTTKLTGLVLTKLDGSSKGGVVLAIRNEMNLPVKLVGLGEKPEDLADFDAANYAIGLFHGLV